MIGLGESCLDVCVVFSIHTDTPFMHSLFCCFQYYVVDAVFLLFESLRFETESIDIVHPESDSRIAMRTNAVLFGSLWDTGTGFCKEKYNVTQWKLITTTLDIFIYWQHLRK